MPDNHHTIRRHEEKILSQDNPTYYANDILHIHYPLCTFESGTVCLRQNMMHPKILNIKTSQVFEDMR